jgi:hypothetical protein
MRFESAAGSRTLRLIIEPVRNGRMMKDWKTRNFSSNVTVHLAVSRREIGRYHTTPPHVSM